MCEDDVNVRGSWNCPAHPIKDTQIMPDTPDASPKMDADAFRTLLRIAGLDVSEDRAPAVLDELNVQLAFARTLDSVLEGAVGSDFGTYDPTFPKMALKDEAE
jgi:hypothetical protein